MSTQMEQELHALLKDFVKEFQNHKAEFTADPKLVHIYRRGTFASAGQPRYAGSHSLNTGWCFNVGILYQQLNYIVIKLDSSRKLYDLFLKYNLWHVEYESYDKSINIHPSATGCVLGGFLVRNFGLNNNRFDVTDQSFEVAFAELIRFFKKDFVEYDLYLHLQCVGGEADEIVINDEVAIRKAGVQLAQLFSINYTGDELHSNIEVYEDDYLLKLTFKLPKTLYTQYGATKASEAERKIVAKWRNLILMTFPGFLRFGKMLYYSQDWPVVYWQATGPFGREPMPYLQNKTTCITPEVALSVQQNANLFTTLSEDFSFDKKILYAIERLTKAKATENIDDRVVELSIALEFLINTEDRDVTLQLTLKIIKLLYDNNSDDTLFARIKKFYTLRSKIVHGNDKIKADDVNKAIIDFAEQLIQKATLRLMELNTHYDYKTIDSALSKSLHVIKSLSELLPLGDQTDSDNSA